LSLKNYTTKYPLLAEIVELIFCEVATDNIKNCDLSELSELFKSNAGNYLNLKKKICDYLRDQLENKISPLDIGKNIKLFELAKEFKIEVDFSRFLKVKSLDESYANYKLLSNYVSIDIYKDHFATLLMADMKLKCKQGSKLSLKKYTTKYPLLAVIVELIFCEVAKDNIKNCDLSELSEVFKTSGQKVFNELKTKKINDLLYDSIVNDDIFTAIDLINEYLDELDLSTLSSQLTNPYLIDYLIKKILDKSDFVFTNKNFKMNISAYIQQPVRQNFTYCFYTYNICLLLLSSIVGDNVFLTDYIMGHELSRMYLTNGCFKYYCSQFMAYSYANDNFSTFEKYCLALKKFDNFKEFCRKIEGNNGEKFIQKNNLLDLFQIKISFPKNQKIIKNQKIKKKINRDALPSYVK
jgi:hypothetical protein